MGGERVRSQLLHRNRRVCTDQKSFLCLTSVRGNPDVTERKVALSPCISRDGYIVNITVG